ncbi:M14 family zinc carboxypeptidase [Paenibacillus koleovorans]|uniref:M14 family zinc carboxypeptidase n=1 Tax=Paenibacillus koleovorans TaxID=121608 RepID=UPI000FD7A43A|nr:M14 family zinc carboxypeptidase [Paenibacillus koleovorans]
MSAIFMSNPTQLEAKLEEWLKHSPDRIRVEYETAYSGHKVYAISLSDFAVPDEKKRKLYVAQPHAHEPATTAGMIDVIEQLVAGYDLAGRPTLLDVGKVLAGMVVTFNPIGNPGGVERSPYPYWDGTEVPNERFWCIMFGEDPDAPGQRWNRVDQFDTKELQAPDPIGIAYEQLDAYTYVEPNRTQLSSYSKLFRRMDAEYRYDYWLDLHQTEFVNSATQCQILLPTVGLQTDEIRIQCEAWANHISEVWREAGFVVRPPAPLGYTGTQAEYFRRNWGDIHRRMCKMTVEVKNNSACTPPERQMEAEALAVVATIRRICGEV